jgi:hypothetical protein
MYSLAQQTDRGKILGKRRYKRISGDVLNIRIERAIKLAEGRVDARECPVDVPDGIGCPKAARDCQDLLGNDGPATGYRDRDRYADRQSFRPYSAPIDDGREWALLC